MALTLGYLCLTLNKLGIQQLARHGSCDATLLVCPLIESGPHGTEGRVVDTGLRGRRLEFPYSSPGLSKAVAVLGSGMSSHVYVTRNLKNSCDPLK